MTEIWKSITGYESYEVSSFGRIRRLIGGRYKLLRFGINSSGYCSVTVSVNNVKTSKQVHFLVALMFVSNPNNYIEINHKDGNKLNNCEDNLEWVTRIENVHHAIKTGLMKVWGKDNPNYKHGKKSKANGVHK